MTSCPACGAPVAGDARFCAQCGSALAADRPPGEERKVVSILFVDLVGFTARSDAADPEDVRDVLQLYQSVAKQRVEQHGGVLEKFIGDAVMAVFGAPVAHGDDAERAVRAGLRILADLEELERERRLGLAARAAVNTGEAVVTLHPAAGAPLATGDVVNTASRLQAAAPTGRLLVGADTHRASSTAIRYEPYPAVDAKGKTQPVAAWLAVEPVVEPGERRRTARPLVGRSREVELLQSIWRRCLDELRPHLVTVVGPPGIGKSRLCREFAERVSVDGGRVFRGRCLPYDERVGYQAFGGIVRTAAGIFESDPAATAREKLDVLVRRVMSDAEAAELAPRVALLAGMPSEASVPQLEMLFFYARRFLECLGSEQATVMVFEDIHWAEPTELELLQYLARHLRDSSVLLLAAARPELLDQHPTWGAGLAAQTTVPVEPLSTHDAVALAASLIPPDDQSAFRFDRIVEAAGGNPLFLEELAAAVEEAAAGDVLPITVREAIAARIDALPHDARTALLAAATIGRTSWRGVIDAVGGVQEVDAALAELEVRDLVRRDPSSQLAGDTQFTFKHILICDVAYGTIPRAARRSRHAAIAEHIERVLGDGAGAMSAVLAHHWRQAGRPDRAVPYLVAAAEAARRGWAHDAAIDLYSLAIEIVGDDRRRRELRLERAVALVGAWEMERAADELVELLPELDGQERLDALVALGHAYVWTERDADALETAERAAALLDEAVDPTTEAAVVAMRSQALAMRGDDGDIDEAYELGERALAAWQPEARPLDLAHHLHLHTDVVYWIGDYERALELARRTRDVASDVHVAEAFLRGGGSEALSLAGLGRHEEAIAIWDRLLVAADELGRSRGGLLNYSTLAYRELYDVDEARARTEEALELSPRGGFSMPRQFAGSDLVFTELIAGETGRAQTVWRERWDEVDEATAWTTWLVAGRLAVARAEIALTADAPDVALEWAQRSLDIARRTRRRKYEARSLTLIGRALTQLGRKDEALDALAKAVPIADALIGPPARWEARSALAEAAYTLGEDGVAAAAHDEAASLVAGFAQTLASDRAARFLGAPQVAHLVAGRDLVHRPAVPVDD